MARDDFNRKTINQLQRRVSHQCSNPDCRVQTVGSNSNDGLSASIGVAAHIHAASPGGPRYLSSMSSMERKALNNGIWLCNSCATLIDKDKDLYTAELLRVWKNKAEAESIKLIGKKPPHHEDAINQVTMALSGFPKKFIPSAISNVHLATKDSLEALDPRFKVNTKYINDTSHFEILAKQPATISMVIGAKSTTEYLEKYNELVISGKDLVIGSDEITFEGSKLFEELLSGVNGGVITITAPRKKATIKLWTQKTRKSKVERFEDVIGTLSLGTSEASFVGSACNEIFQLNIKRLNFKGDRATIDVNLNLQKWDDVDVRYLPFSLSLFSLFKEMTKGSTLYTALTVDGLDVIKGIGKKYETSNYFKQYHYFFEYTRAAKSIASFLNISILFNSETTFTLDEYNKIIHVADILEGNNTTALDPKVHTVQFDLEITEDLQNIKIMNSVTEPSIFEMQENEELQLTIFGQIIKLPKAKLTLHHVLPRVTQSLDDLKVGDIVKGTLILSTNSKVVRTYEKSI